MLKTVSSITNAIGALNYKGAWNASTNTPTLTSGVGTKGDYYQVSVDGATTLNGISNWGVGDVVAFNGATWQRIEGGADLNGVNLSYTGTLTGGKGVLNIGSGQIYKGAFGHVGLSTTSETHSGPLCRAQIAFPGGVSEYGIGMRPNANNTTAIFFSNADAIGVGSIAITAVATAYNTTSDYRLKENIHPMQNALDVVAKLNPVTYTWKIDGSSGEGFIAHELQSVLPSCVTGEKDSVDKEGRPKYQSIDQSKIVPVLVKAVQELTAEIEDLKSEIQKLKGN